MPRSQRNSTTDRPRARPPACLGAFVVGLGLFTVSCGASASTASTRTGDEPRTVVATTSIWADVVANVACDGNVTVETIVPIGGDPHAFEPSLRDRERLDNAALVVVNGLDLEAGLDDVLGSVVSGGTPQFEMAANVETITIGGTDDGDADPHLWFDPIRVSAALPALGDALVEHAGIDPAEVSECVAAYQRELVAVDEEITALTTTLAADERKLVTSHDSLGYFADRYGFEVIGTVIPSSSTLAQANPAKLQALADLIEQEGVSAVFAETQHSAEDTTALAGQVGVEVVFLATGTLDEQGTGADSYVGLLRTNARLIVDGLN